MISFLRIDDRLIHGQNVWTWSKKYPCTGLIGVNDEAAEYKILKEAYKHASKLKTFIWSKDQFMHYSAKVLASQDQYFLITRNAIDMKELLIDQAFKPGCLQTIVVGPCAKRPHTVRLSDSQYITEGEAEAFDALEKAGYHIVFALTPDDVAGSWSDVKKNITSA